MDDILFRALTGALILAAMLGPLGSFVVWRRMAYFGDTIAHASLLGVALSLLSRGALPMTPAIFLVALGVAVTLSRLTRGNVLQADTILGMLAHATLAIGLVLVAINREVRIDVNAYLFGDVLTIDWRDVALLALLAAVALVTLIVRWRRLLVATVHPAIAQIEGVSPAREQLVLTLLLAAAIAVAIKFTGMLLITALLVIPAATARFFAKAPAQMAVLASLCGMMAVSSGLLAAFQFDTPAGPTMVVAAAIIFVLSASRFRPR